MCCNTTDLSNVRWLKYHISIFVVTSTSPQHIIGRDRTIAAPVDFEGILKMGGASGLPLARALQIRRPYNVASSPWTAGRRKCCQCRRCLPSFRRIKLGCAWPSVSCGLPMAMWWRIQFPWSMSRLRRDRRKWEKSLFFLEIFSKKNGLLNFLFFKKRIFLLSFFKKTRNFQNPVNFAPRKSWLTLRTSQRLRSAHQRNLLASSRLELQTFP